MKLRHIVGFTIATAVVTTVTPFLMLVTLARISTDPEVRTQYRNAKSR